MKNILFSTIFFAVALFKAYADPGSYMYRIVDEAGRLNGFKSIVGFIDPEKDYLSIHSWRSMSDQYNNLEIKFFNSKELKGSSILSIGPRGVFLEDRQICFCGKAEVNHRREVTRITSQVDECAEGHWGSDFIICPNNFPLYYGNNGYSPTYIIQYDEKVDDKKIKINYEGKDYYADLSHVEDIQFQISKNRYLEIEKKKVKDILDDRSFSKYQERFWACLNNHPQKCLDEFIDSKFFPGGFCVGKIGNVYISDEDTDPTSESEDIQNGVNCFTSQESFLKKFSDDCLKQKNHPFLKKHKEDVIWVYMSYSDVCVFRYIDGKWKYSGQEILGC